MWLHFACVQISSKIFFFMICAQPSCVRNEWTVLKQEFSWSDMYKWWMWSNNHNRQLFHINRCLEKRYFLLLSLYEKRNISYKDSASLRIILIKQLSINRFSVRKESRTVAIFFYRYFWPNIVSNNDYLWRSEKINFHPVPKLRSTWICPWDSFGFAVVQVYMTMNFD